MTRQKPRPPLSSANRRPRAVRAPILWAGVLFAAAANMLLVNLAHRLVRAFSSDLTWETVATFVAPLLVGMATVWYVRRRGGMHALLGGLLSIPLLALTAFDGNWQFAVIAGAMCGMGGSIFEILLRRGQVR